MKQSAWSILGSCLGLLSVTVIAAPYPERPIRFVVPFAAGGGSDYVARVLGPKLTEGLSQQIIVDNRPGAGGMLGSELVAKSPGDGYTLLLNDTPFTVNASLYAKPTYDPVKDFTGITMVATVPLMLVVNSSVPATTVKEFVALAKAQSGKLNMASGGSGGIAHLAGELFKMSTGITYAHVPYKGIGPALTDVLGGQVQFMFATSQAAMPYLNASRLRALAVTGAGRSPSAPDIPTMAEAGVANCVITNWYGVAAPAATPKSIIDRLYAALVKATQSADMRDRYATAGLDAVVNKSPDEFTTFVASEVKKWHAVVQRSGMRVE